MPEVQIEGLAAFRKALRGIDSKYNNSVRTIYRRISDLVGGRARLAMSARLGKGVKSRATNTAAYIEIVPSGDHQDVLARVMGAKRRTGWYAKHRYIDSTPRQFPPWVGNQWDPGSASGKPYHIGAAVDASVDEIVRIFEDGVVEVAHEAFPN